MRFAVSVAVVLMIASCGGGDDTDSRSPTGNTGAVSPTPAVAPDPTATAVFEPVVQTYAVPAGSRPHDVAPAADGGVWYTAQGSGELGWLDPATGEVVETSLGAGSAPHGVIV